jgi:glutamate-1-semialdehyde 2,1-aminomutase
LAMRAGIATLKELSAPGFFETIERRSRQLADGLRNATVDVGVAAQVNAVGSLVTIFFTSEPVRNYSDAKKSDTKRYAEFFRNMLEHGIFLAPSQYEAAFVSAAHTDADIDRTLAAAVNSLRP